VARDAAGVADVVQVDPIGTSGVLELTVTDRDEQVAGLLAASLADEVVRIRAAVVLGDTRRLMGTTDEQIQALGAELSDLAKRIARIESAQDGQILPVPAMQLRHDAAVAQHNALEDRRTSLIAQRQQLAQELAATPRPRVIDPAASMESLASVGLPARLVVGGMLGLILGVGLAAVWEMRRPKLDESALAARLDAPLLGRLQRPPTADAEPTDPWLASYFDSVCERAEARHVDVVPVGPKVDLTGLIRSLTPGRHGYREVAALSLDVAPEIESSPPGSRLETAVVVVAPRRLKASALAALERHVRLTGKPVIGLITYRGRPGADRPRADGSDVAPEPMPAPEASASRQVHAVAKPDVPPTIASVS
jgi:hypothetical protein